jgi:SulP family sulfate permease
MRFKGGDIWGGLAAAVVALPAAIGFGVAVYEPLGQSFNAQGVMAGMVGATLLGVLAARFGGCQRLISSPCAPAAAVLSAFAIQFTQGGMPAEQVLLSLLLIGAVAGALQIMFGLARLGELIKYMPYPVVSGYLSGVGLIIIASQMPKWLGVYGNGGLWFALTSPEQWRVPSLIVGAVAMTLMWLGPRITARVPAVVIAMAGGAVTYWMLGFWDPVLRTLEGNNLIVGPLGGASAGAGSPDAIGGLSNFFSSLLLPWRAVADAHLPSIGNLLYPALTLAVLLSIDTLKTCVVLDTLTRSQHDSNRELIGQGIGNLTSALCSGMPGAGTMGATLVNISSGARSSNSGMIEGAIVLLAYLLLAPFLSWIPLASLAAILIVVGLRMIDRHSFFLARSADTRVDFAVVITVAVVAQVFSLIAATGTGLLLAALLFLRKQIGTHILRRATFGNQVFSRCERLEHERALLEEKGRQTAILGLQGPLFFGTANQLLRAAEPYLTDYRYLILDMKWVQSVDLSAVHVLERIRDRLAENGHELILSDLPGELPSGENLRQYFDHTGILQERMYIRVVNELDDALEYIEEQWLIEAGLRPRTDQIVTLRDFDVFRYRKDDTLADLEACMERRSLAPGEKLFAAGDQSDEIYFILKGEIRLDVPLPEGREHHIASHHQGDFIGELGFLDGRVRADSATAVTAVELFSLSRVHFDQLVANHKLLGVTLITEIARVLASRLRQTNDELRLIESL